MMRKDKPILEMPLSQRKRLSAAKRFIPANVAAAMA